MESKTEAPVSSSTTNPNTSQPNSPSKHIADIDNVAPPCLIAGISLSTPRDNQPAVPPMNEPLPTNSAVEGPIPAGGDDAGGDDAGTGVDTENKKLIFSDSYFGDVVDSNASSPVEDITPKLPKQRHCLLVYRTSPKVKESSARKSMSKAKGNLYKTSGMYSLPTLSMSEILEMEEEQQALVEEPGDIIGLEDLSLEQASGSVLAEAGPSGANPKSNISNQKAVQCVDLPAVVQRDDLWITSVLPCLDTQHILVIVGPHDGHLRNDGTASNVTKCNTVQSESRFNINQQNDLNKGSAFEDGEYEEQDQPPNSSDINPSFSKPFAKFFSENMPHEEASGGPSVEDIATGDGEFMKPFAKFLAENPGLAQNSSSSSSSSTFVPQDQGSDSGPFAKIFAGNSEDLTLNGKTDSRYFPRKQPATHQQELNGSNNASGIAEKDSMPSQPSQQNGYGYVLVYKLECVDSMVSIVKEPVHIHSMEGVCKSFTKVVSLPAEICDSGSDEESDVKPDVIPQQPEELAWQAFDEADAKGPPGYTGLGKFAALTGEGKVVVFDAATFDILSTLVPSNLQSPPVAERTSSQDVFVAMIYCVGMERLCVCSSSGNVTFLQLATRDTNRSGKRSKRTVKADAGDLDTDSVREDTDAADDDTGMCKQYIEHNNL